VRCEAGIHIPAGAHRPPASRLGQCLASHRELYNAALQERRDAWRLRKTTVSHLRRLNRAFAGFFRRVNVGQTPGYPRFKPAHRFDSVEWPEDGDGCRWHADTRKVYLQGIGQVEVTVHRQVEGRVKTIQVRRQGRRWMLILSCDGVPTRPLESTQAVEDLKIRNMMRRPAPLVSILRAKAEEAGRVVIDVDARHTSARCGACGHTAKENRASQAVFACRSCGHTLNADGHAARNILRAGLARLAANPAA
jgi:transposase